MAPAQPDTNSVDPAGESLVDSTHRWNTTALTVILQRLIAAWTGSRTASQEQTPCGPTPFPWPKAFTALAIGAAREEGLAHRA